MTFTQRMRMRALDLTGPVLTAIQENNGHVSGTIVVIKRSLGLSCQNNELRQALNILCDWDRLRGMAVEYPGDRRKAPLHRRTGNYSYHQLPLEHAVELAKEKLLALMRERQPFGPLLAGTTSAVASALNFSVDPLALSIAISELRHAEVIKAPLSDRASDSRPLSEDSYLFLELKDRQRVH